MRLRLFALCLVAPLSLLGCDSDPGTPDTGTPMTDSGPTGTDAGPGPVDAGPGPVDAGPMPTDASIPVHGCTRDAATDMTGMAAVTLSGPATWSFGHHACIRVSTGTAVTWEGDFSVHPLIGGITPTMDAASPVTLAGPGSGATPVVVTFGTAGDFPYFCGVHTASMTGVIYVE